VDICEVEISAISEPLEVLNMIKHITGMPCINVSIEVSRQEDLFLTISDISVFDVFQRQRATDVCTHSGGGFLKTPFCPKVEICEVEISAISEPFGEATAGKYITGTPSFNV
jgi:hypothetical protein